MWTVSLSINLVLKKGMRKGKISVLVCTRRHTDEQSAGSQPLLYCFGLIFTMNSRQDPVTSSHQNPDKSRTEEMLTCLFESALVSLHNVLEATRLRSSDKCSAALFLIKLLFIHRDSESRIQEGSFVSVVSNFMGIYSQTQKVNAD